MKTLRTLHALTLLTLLTLLALPALAAPNAFTEPAGGEIVAPDPAPEQTRFISAGQVSNVDTPNATNKIVNYNLDPDAYYVTVVILTVDGVVQQRTGKTFTGTANLQPNVTRDGPGWRGFFVYKVPKP